MGNWQSDSGQLQHVLIFTKATLIEKGSKIEVSQYLMQTRNILLSPAILQGRRIQERAQESHQSLRSRR